MKEMASVSRFCTSPELCHALIFPILSSNNPSTSSSKVKGWNAYGTLGLVLGAPLLLTAIVFALPRPVGAFWPFSVANAQTATPQPMLHDASLNLLTAPASSYIDYEFNGYSGAVVDGSMLSPNISGEYAASSTPSAAPSVSPDNSSSSASDNAPGSISTYTVKQGDNLSTIAQNYGVSLNTILWANNVKSPGDIKAGTKLVILPVSGVAHEVVKGDTLSSIAKEFGGDAGDIAQFNGLPDTGALKVGSTVIIPGGTQPVVKAKAKTKTASGSGSSSTKSSGTTSSSSKVHCDNTSGNPCHGISGPVLSGFFTNPVPGALISQGLHGWDAVDLAAPQGTPIHAAASGSVILARMGGWNGGYGNYVIIDNGSGVETLYAHMHDMQVSVGDGVSAGETIGSVGITGDATGTHLHFEVRGARNPFAHCAGNETVTSNECFSN
jgi:murein DD-endopeptidase MepM/ murein hydrolase activator NlpD